MKTFKIYIILRLIHTFSYVDIKPAKRLQCSASSLNDVIMQCRYVSIPYRRASVITRSTVSYKQTYALVLSNNEFYQVILYYLSYYLSSYLSYLDGHLYPRRRYCISQGSYKFVFEEQSVKRTFDILLQNL